MQIHAEEGCNDVPVRLVVYHYRYMVCTPQSWPQSRVFKVHGLN
jgi:hypothetical protein